MRRSRVLWRWRRNPLCGRSYAVEGWALLALSTAALAGAALAGSAVAGGIDARYAEQRHDRHPATAVLTEDAAVPVTYAAEPRTRVRWTLPGEPTRTGAARVGAGLKSGDRATIWLDSRGRPAPKPPSPSGGQSDAAVTGTAAALGICAGALIGVGLTAGCWERRRVDRWGAEWAQVGPQWAHRAA
ncbi:hypothetical protein GA0115240_137719 [Streptomyces sp. DvalAA-14]|uniref:Rv1733c family protein n=1 Tax=unclassified Streptomyces TaxID=2593676 RepID=UPI00081B7FC9|nr:MULTISPECIES: hypothetical protein [unclassified Streptomyces]MYS22033.1 hypothetical protein [Streptomyces sp. SID4948]SCE07121.1 hypothetical protein GA0115240_137719 [Streptomyces sp. DvalAA-14]